MIFTGLARFLVNFTQTSDLSDPVLQKEPETPTKTLDQIGSDTPKKTDRIKPPSDPQPNWWGAPVPVRSRQRRFPAGADKSFHEK